MTPMERVLCTFGRKKPDTVPEIMQVLEVTRELAWQANGKIPVVGIVMSPFSQPVMQMGFEKLTGSFVLIMPRHNSQPEPQPLVISILLCPQT